MFVDCVEAVIHLFLYSLHDCTFKSSFRLQQNIFGIGIAVQQWKNSHASSAAIGKSLCIKYSCGKIPVHQVHWRENSHESTTSFLGINHIVLKQKKYLEVLVFRYFV